MEWLRRLGFRLINKRLVSVASLERRGRQVFAPLFTPAGETLLAGMEPAMRKRVLENPSFFTEMALLLGLDRSSKGLRVLDLGGYNGMWSRACNHFGHQALSTDMPATLEKPEVRAMLDLLGVRARPLAVPTLAPLPGDLGGPYDLITGFRTRFHSTKPRETGADRETHWGVPEWEFFLRDVLRFLAPGGRVFFVLNRLREWEQGGGVPPDIARLFERLGWSLKGAFLRYPAAGG